jgi:hypothetical protein
MKTYIKKLPHIIDLQPVPEGKAFRLPGWMKYLFIGLYLVTLVGMGMLLHSSIKVFKLYQEMVQARRVAATTIQQINLLQTKLVDCKGVQKEYDTLKLHQYQVTRMGTVLEWIPSLISKAQRAHTIVLQQNGESLTVRITLEKPIADAVARVVKAPTDYVIQSSGEETPKFVDLPQGPKANINNEYTALAIQLKKHESEH